jgi:[ribosomal protein S18]-alanine N-acetyltransferase
VQFSLRDFRPEDIETLWRIDQDCFPPGIAYSRPELMAYVRRRDSFTIVAEMPAEERGEIVAFITAEANRRGVGHIITIDVLPQLRRSGLGSKLLAACEGRLQKFKCKSVILETAVDNLAALSFYKRHQYFLVKTVPRYYSTGADAFVLSKRLA